MRQVQTLMVMIMTMTANEHLPATTKSQKHVTSLQHAVPQYRGWAHILSCATSASYFEITDCPMKTIFSHKEC
jgi:hypothetical protein